ncbi:MAG: biotin transporter BioY [Clostridia bacterium]|nr:biotin transporter BioY [Clostridia bacterium]
MRNNRLGLSRMCNIALFAAIICVFSPFTVPIGAVPITLSLFVIFLSAVVLDFPDSAIAVAVYIMLGVFGLPVFSGGRGGFSVIIGPTGGFIVAYIGAVIIVGLLVRLTSVKILKFRWIGYASAFVFCLFGLVLCYLLGTVWYCVYSKAGFGEALKICILPFLPFDMIKCILASYIGIEIRSVLISKGLLQKKNYKKQKNTYNNGKK